MASDRRTVEWVASVLADAKELGWERVAERPGATKTGVSLLRWALSDEREFWKTWFKVVGLVGSPTGHTGWTSGRRNVAGGGTAVDIERVLGKLQGGLEASDDAEPGDQEAASEQG